MSKRKPSSGKAPYPGRSRSSGPAGRKRKQRREKEEEHTPAESPRRRIPSAAAVRETIESVVIAFVLAFLFRTFEAEAFVIPTGSMAPTLMGRHKDLECPVCGYQYQASASDEVDEKGNLSGYYDDYGVFHHEDHRIERCICPMCRYEVKVGPGNPQGEHYPSFKGDRILVGKFAYQFNQPRRWDVAVFKFPGDAATNYIKRLVGLPGEKIRISHGDIKVWKESKNESQGKFEIARKERPRKLLAMLQPVYDNDCVLPENINRSRWQSWPPTNGHWATSEDGRSFHTTGTGRREAWLRYRHLVPSRQQQQQWRDALPEEWPRKGPLGPKLISDFCAYNTSEAPKDRVSDPARLGLHWVGDLALKCTVDVAGDCGEVILELVEGGRRMQCRINVESGKAALSISGTDRHGQPARTHDENQKPFQPTAQTDVKGPGQYKIIFANCDDQLRLWVDGSIVEFDTTTCYLPLKNTCPTEDDLAPVGIASKGAEFRVSHLKVLRDVYYIAVRPTRNAADGRPMTDFKQLYLPDRLLSEPSLWETAFNDSNMKEVTFDLTTDHSTEKFLALGDNSPKSSDSRHWENRNKVNCYVSREMLIGKAFFIYWPHSWNRVPGTKIPFPLFPNFPKMGMVR